MKAAELTALASDYLAARYPGALIVTEFSIGNWGKALIDVAAITEKEIVGVEIKGDGDSSARIALQAAVYSKAATRMFMLPAPSLEAVCWKHIPDCWGRLKIGEAGAIVRDATRWNDRKDAEPAMLCTAPRQLAQSLWRDELYAIAREQGVITTKRATVDVLLDAVSEQVPLATLRPAVCAQLRARTWLKPVRMAA